METALATSFPKASATWARSRAIFSLSGRPTVEGLRVTGDAKSSFRIGPGSRFLVGRVLSTADEAKRAASRSELFRAGQVQVLVAYSKNCWPFHSVKTRPSEGSTGSMDSWTRLTETCVPERFL